VVSVSEVSYEGPVMDPRMLQLSWELGNSAMPLDRCSAALWPQPPALMKPLKSEAGNNESEVHEWRPTLQCVLQNVASWKSS
jgi:hypothetical protein